MTPEQNIVLKALYDIEEPELQSNRYNTWTSPLDIANRLPEDDPHYGDEIWVRERLSELWIARKVLQVPDEAVEPENIHDVVLTGMDVQSSSEINLAVEDNDCRGTPLTPVEQVAIYGPRIHLRYRSRMAEVARLLSKNFQRFKMIPATGLLRYERLQQSRPVYSVSIQGLVKKLKSNIQQGRIQITRGNEDDTLHNLKSSIDSDILCRSVEIVFTALHELFNERNLSPNLAPFQVQSITTTLCGLYSADYRHHHDAHVVTAGVGSGKTFAFQIGALIHAVYRALQGKQNLQILLLYPRVVLAANQFQDLNNLVDRVVEQGVTIRLPVLDAGGQLPDQMGIDRTQRGALYQSIQRAYKGDFQILISNLDTIANRLVHPEACQGLVNDLDLVVIDEIHLLSGLYGAHARMLLKRIMLMRSLSRQRSKNPDAMFEKLLEQHNQGQVPLPYFIGASATISEPRKHASRLLDFSLSRVLHVDVGQTQHYGSIHHLFLRQRPEVSAITAVVNATSCLIHNRRNGLFREYYQRISDNEATRPLVSLSDFENPVRPSTLIEPRETQLIHKTLGFCDSLDGVGRWADLVADNERTKTASMSTSVNPAFGDPPYFVRFQEPLWRAIHHITFGSNPAIWIQRLWSHYGSLCQNCKKGIRALIDRIPGGLTAKQQNRVEELWDFSEDNDKSYMAKLSIGREFLQADWFDPLRIAGQGDRIGNLDACPFFQTCLCWWWSMDHMGSNHPIPVTPNTPLNGYKQPLNNPSRFYHSVNAIRIRHFTSQTSYDTFKASRIDDLFHAPANSLFRDRNFDRQTEENCVFIIGSPRIEVGIDLSRVCDGITFRAMRDPASLQQKSGRVGREMMADSMMIHIVTENARDHFYFRNPRIALDPDYLQPIPLHEDNQIVARNHFFMAINDFLCLQGNGPEIARIKDYGDRLNLINDHLFNPSFANWERKVKAVYDFLFGSHPRRSENLSNLVSYLEALGARDTEITNPSAADLLNPQTAPLTQPVGAVDVFRHEFGVNLLLTNIGTEAQPFTLADLCANEYPPTFAINRPDLPRHQEFIETYNTYYAGRERGPKPRLDRGYMWKILGLPLFRRGLPMQNLPGNHPFIWAPNLFQSAGEESIRVFEDIEGRRIELGYESLSLALALLVPGVVSYRYSARARKVPVNEFGAKGLTPILPRVEGVCLEVDDPEYFQAADCPELNLNDLPGDFIGTGAPVKVYSPRQIGMIWASSEPTATIDGLLADNDSRPLEAGIYPLATPPRCYPLHWFRIERSEPIDIPCRFQERFTSTGGSRVPRLPWPETFSIFTEVTYDPSLEITEYTWGLDRQFMTRQVDPARLVYRSIQGDPVALGHGYRSPGICFHIDIGNNSPIHLLFDDIWQNVDSGVHQSLLLQVLHFFLQQFATHNPMPGAPIWAAPVRPSIFTVRNLKTIILFHLLEQWHPDLEELTGPNTPLIIELDDLVGCFTQGHANYLSEGRFRQICSWVATSHNPASIEQHTETLERSYENFLNACNQVNQLHEQFFRNTGIEILINSLGLVIHGASLRLTGAESSDIRYFYQINNNTEAIIYLFDKNELGNGATDLVRDTFFISSIERVLNAKLKALGVDPDPLPSVDFSKCLEDAMQECASSQAAQLAFHNLCASQEWEELNVPCIGERQIAGNLFDFIRGQLSIFSFDHTFPLQSCPEFLVHLGEYPFHQSSKLVPSDKYPTYQALESAVGYCSSGCVSCLLAPEQNLHGSLSAKETVNKLLLDVFYRTTVCESGTNMANALYPATESGRTVSWMEASMVVTASVGQALDMENIVVELTNIPDREVVRLTVFPSTVPNSLDRVFRTDWNPAPQPNNQVRIRMTF